MKSFSRKAALLGAVFGMAACLAGTANAQELEEIVVTARSRGESIQSVPLAITAFSTEELDKRAVVDMRDVSRMTPGFVFETYASGATSPVIRGASQIGGAGEAVSFFFDGVYLPTDYVSDIGFWGIERLEVVKGPQSARYGRNAFTGAINYVVRKASTTELQAEVEGTAGIYDRYDASGLVSVPIIKDKLGVIGGITHSTFDGSWKNLHPFCDADLGNLGTDCRVGGYDKTTWNVGLTFKPMDRLTIDATYFNISRKLEQPQIGYFGELNSNSQLLNCGVYNPTVRPPGPGLGAGGDWRRLYCGELPQVPMPVDPRGYGLQLKAGITRVGLTYDVSEAVSLSYVYGRVSSNAFRNQYNDQIPGCTYLFPGQCLFSSVGFNTNLLESHDFRLSFDNDGPVRLAMGYLYSPTRNYAENAFASAPPLTAPPTNPLRPNVRGDYGTTYSVLGRSLTKNVIYSPFAEVQISLMDNRLRLGAEARYTQEKRYQQALAVVGTGGLLGNAGLAFNATYDAFTPRFTVDFDLAPRHLLYGSAAKGIKSGGFNVNAFLPENRIFDQDSNWTYEVGTKNTWGRLRFNAAAFLIKWSNMQIPAADPGNPAPLPQSITANLGNFTSKGLEAELEYAFNDNFTVSGTGYYGSATYDEGTRHLGWARTPAVCDNVVCPTNGDISGNQAPRAPKFMSTLAAQWTDQLPISTGLEYYIRGDMTYQSKAFADEMNLAWVPDRMVFNGSMGITADRWEIQFWVRNLLDKKYVSVASIQQPNVAYNSPFGERRTLGVTVSARY